jgi:hypothetical protein
MPLHSLFNGFAYPFFKEGYGLLILYVSEILSQILRAGCDRPPVGFDYQSTNTFVIGLLQALVNSVFFVYTFGALVYGGGGEAGGEFARWTWTVHIFKSNIVFSVAMGALLFVNLLQFLITVNDDQVKDVWRPLIPFFINYFLYWDLNILWHALAPRQHWTAMLIYIHFVFMALTIAIPVVTSHGENTGPCTGTIEYLGELFEEIALFSILETAFHRPPATSNDGPECADEAAESV